MASDQATVAALGRPFKLGMLYDARTDQLLRGSALWDQAAIQSMTQTRPQPYSDFKLSASDSTEEKASLLEVQASLRASVLCGFVKAEGSAKFLHSKQQFKNQSRVTLQYKATTHFEQLSITADAWDDVTNRDMMEAGLATHVVTGIEYGANAFFVFDSQILEASDVQEFTLRVKVVINLIFFSLEFDFSRDLTEEQKSLVKTLKVKFYSDFLLERCPATVTEALQTYRDLTKLLGEHGQNAVPARVWMMPLKHVSPEAAGLVRPISVGLVIEAESALEQLDGATMRCNDSLSVTAVGKFPPLQNQLLTFQKLCHYYTVELRRQMAETCPAIRDGTETESALRSLFDLRDASPFSQDKLTQWLESKEREVNVVQSCLDIMRDVPVLSTQAEVDGFVMDPGHAVCSGFVFTSLQSSDPQLEEMARYLGALRAGQPHEPRVGESGQSWFYCDETVRAIRATAEAFAQTSGPLFIAAEHGDHKGAAVVQYREGQLQG